LEALVVSTPECPLPVVKMVKTAAEVPPETKLVVALAACSVEAGVCRGHQVTAVPEASWGVEAGRLAILGALVAMAVVVVPRMELPALAVRAL
jgi:Ni,Fe-hydrogenase III small subunit